MDNRYGFAIIAYDARGKVSGRWEKTGARYIHSIKVEKERVEFIGQDEKAISFSLKDLKIT